MLRAALASFAIMWLLMVIGSACRVQIENTSREFGKVVSLEKRASSAFAFLLCIIIELAAIFFLGIN